MNLDALFQQIQLTEKQAGEKRRLIQQAKSDINRSYEKINQIKEELSIAKMKLETKVQHLSEKQFYAEILKKREDSLEKQKAELINQKTSLLKIFANAKRKLAEEEDNFTKEVTEFTNEYGLTSNRDLLIKKKVKTEINDLEKEAALLKNEMESMEHKNVQLNALQLEKNELKQCLFTLQSELKDLEKVIREAERMTKDLEAEKVKVTEKPQNDPECLRLKKELENCKDDDWESICETLRTEIEILQMNLSQKRSSNK
ncbi:coiled-coil domain-containing protein 172 isoform B [Patagioenas fasciata monilis]|uniref:Coiled-coil domain-containing protein 172 n=1 Tax=Patagioenas fasciata monilis TaxID=372326 RepID=A0A1V4KI72_PATFA|nr:coiled-coil domain-containing protein 172 isoform A [Patagioenas fasciata monilis]OPJ84166.1 coiled-coil domain-containing protein 172 isoform B [Patagioenas fasciata monilis]